MLIFHKKHVYESFLCLCQGWSRVYSFLPFLASLLGWSLVAPPSSFAALFSVGEAPLALTSPPLRCASLVSKREIRVNNATKRKSQLFWSVFGSVFVEKKG